MLRLQASRALLPVETRNQNAAEIFARVAPKEIRLSYPHDEARTNKDIAGAVSRIKCNTLSVSSDFLVHHLGRGHPAQRLARSPVHQLGDVVEFFLADAR